MSNNAGTSNDGLLDHDEYRKLADEHHVYESRLRVLSEKVVLSDEEQVEETKLKKKKLALRDRMESIARDLRAQAH